MNAHLEFHVLASGSDGNCSIIRGNGTCLMIDAGLSGRALEGLVSMAGIDIKEIDAILLTHEHVDHIRGAGVLSRRHRIPVAGNHRTLREARMGRVERMIPYDSGAEFRVENFSIRSIPLPHAAADPNGFVFLFQDRRCVVATDLGKVTPLLIDEMGRADMVFIESNHDLEMLMNGPYPPFLKASIRSETGHLSNHDCASALASTHRPNRRVFLGHLSKNNNTVELARKEVAGALGCSIENIGCLCVPGEVECVQF